MLQRFFHSSFACPKSFYHYSLPKIHIKRKMARPTACESINADRERSPLLPSNQPTTANVITHPKNRSLQRQVVADEYVHRVLLLALSTSIAMAATAATTVFAYAVILCDDPTQCNGQEKGAYAGAVALAAGVANICGILALGPLQHAVQVNVKYGLMFWIMSRGTSVAVLALGGMNFISLYPFTLMILNYTPPGFLIPHRKLTCHLWAAIVMYKNIYFAILARVFEGFATDNLLHYALSAVYVSTGDKDRFPRLMGYSMALFMVGMSASPTIAGLLPGFYASFIVALSIFFMSLLYLGLFVPVTKIEERSSEQPSTSWTHLQTKADQTEWMSKASWLCSPMTEMLQQRPIAAAGLSLLLFNTTQAYFFSALMVYTSTKLSFTRTQNGYVLSIAATISAFYLMTIYYIKPRLSLICRESPPLTVNNPLDTSSSGVCTDADVEDDRADSTPDLRNISSPASREDYTRALLCLIIYIVMLPGIAITTKASQIYILTSLLALGMTAASFIKNYAVSKADRKAAAVASLATMEGIGSLLSTLVLGTVQSYTGGGGIVFIVASAIMTGSLSALVVSQVLR